MQNKAETEAYRNKSMGTRLYKVDIKNMQKQMHGEILRGRDLNRD